MGTTSGASAAPVRNLEPLDRALAFMREMLGRAADDIRPIDAGCVVRSPSLPAVWGINAVVVTRPRAFGALMALADEELGDLDYRQIAFEDQQTGPGLEDEFRAAGWTTDREVVMVLSTGPDRHVDTSMVIDADEDSVLALMSLWHREGRDVGDEDLGQMVEYSRREARVCGDRLLGVRNEDGQLVAISKLRSHGAVAQVEDVYTVPEARGRGHGRAVVTHAAALARQAGHELVFIVADDNDWPQLLYGRIGFRPVGRRWLFHRG